MPKEPKVTKIVSNQYKLEVTDVDGYFNTVLMDQETALILYDRLSTALYTTPGTPAMAPKLNEAKAPPEPKLSGVIMRSPVLTYAGTDWVSEAFPIGHTPWACNSAILKHVSWAGSLKADSKIRLVAYKIPLDDTVCMYTIPLEDSGSEFPLHLNHFPIDAFPELVSFVEDAIDMVDDLGLVYIGIELVDEPAADTDARRGRTEIPV